MTNKHPKFKGTVYLSPTFKAEMLKMEGVGDFSLTELKDAFKQYWATGFHPSLGQDSSFARPKEILSLSIRKAHVDQGFYPADKGYSATESAWVKWRTGNVASKPSSNAYLIYAVTTERNAMLTAFLSDGAHTTTEENSYMESIIAITYRFYATTGSEPMPLEEHADLFDDKWLED